MDIKRIRDALHEAGGTSASAPAAIAGGASGFNAQGIAPFKSKMKLGEDDTQTSPICKPDPQIPGVVQSTEHAASGQKINPMAGKLSEVTHEVVNLFDEERIAFSETPCVPFTGLQINDFEIGLNKVFDHLIKVIDYNIVNSTDPTNKDPNKLKEKYSILKNEAISHLEAIIKHTEAGDMMHKESEINLADIFLVASLESAYHNNETNMPKAYAKKQAERLIQIAKDDAIDVAKHASQTLIPKLQPNKSAVLGMELATLESIKKEFWGEALFWNKLRKTIEHMKSTDDETDFDVDAPEVEPEEFPEPENHENLENPNV